MMKKKNRDVGMEIRNKEIIIITESRYNKNNGDAKIFESKDNL